MADELDPIDPGPWGAYVRTGRGHFDRVSRSFNIFGRNAEELVGLLHGAETDTLSALRLMESTGIDDEADERFRVEFWGQLDQRLHNAVSSAISAVEHIRPLITFYHHEPQFVTEWNTRSSSVANSPRAQFLRRLRNYLMHCGPAPIMQSMRLGPPADSADDAELTIRLCAAGLLNWPDWSKSHRSYIASFQGGPPLRRITTEYTDDMFTLYEWLMSQYRRLHVPGVPPAHLYP